MKDIEQRDTEQLSIRLSKAILGRVDRLVGRYEAFGANRAAVLRLCIERGIEVVEKEFAQGKQRR